MIKKIFSIVVALAMFCSCTVALAVVDKNEAELLNSYLFKIGDVNTDSVVNVRDATAVQKHLAGLITLSENQLKLADTTRDGNINIKDATYIQKLVAGLVEPIKPEPTQAASTVPETQVTDPTETTGSEMQATDPTDPTVPETQATDPMESTAPETQVTDPAEPTQPATRDPNKPIELPFVPVR